MIFRRKRKAEPSVVEVANQPPLTRLFRVANADTPHKAIRQVKMLLGEWHGTWTPDGCTISEFPPGCRRITASPRDGGKWDVRCDYVSKREHELEEALQRCHRIATGEWVPCPPNTATRCEAIAATVENVLPTKFLSEVLGIPKGPPNRETREGDTVACAIKGCPRGPTINL